MSEPSKEAREVASFAEFGCNPDKPACNECDRCLFAGQIDRLVALRIAELEREVERLRGAIETLARNERLRGAIETLVAGEVISASRARELHGMTPEQQREHWRQRMGEGDE